MNTIKIIVVMFLWSVCFPLITMGLPYAPHLTFATLRALLAGALLLAVAMYLRRSILIGWLDSLQIAVVGLGATTLGFFGMFHAAEFVSPGIATVVANSQPILAAVLAQLVLGERLDQRGKLGLLLGFLGIGLIASPQLFDDQANNYLIGIGYIVLAAIGVSVSNVMMKQMARKHDPLVAMGWQLLMGAIPLALLAWSTEDVTTVRWEIDFITSLVGLAIFGTAIVYWLWYSVLSEVALGRANVFSFLVPLFGLFLGYTFYNEQLSLAVGVGAAVTVLGIWLVSQAKITTSSASLNAAE